MASELLSFLPGGRLKIFHRCMVGTFCEFKIFFIFLMCICFFLIWLLQI